jgi:hypothetical protein
MQTLYDSNIDEKQIIKQAENGDLSAQELRYYCTVRPME